MAALSAGVLVVDIDGQIIEAEGDFTIQANATSRESVVGESGKVFSKTTPIAPTIKGSILVTEEITPEWYRTIIDKAASVRLRDGRVYSAIGVTSVAGDAFDTRLDNLSLAPTLFADGFETGNTSRWSATVP